MAAAVPPAAAEDRYVLRQRPLALDEVYDVAAGDGGEQLRAQRPSHLLRNIGVLLVAAVAWSACAGGGAALGLRFDALTLGMIVGSLLGGVSATLIALRFAAPRHIVIQRLDGTVHLTVRQDRTVAPLVAVYSILDARDNLLAVIRCNRMLDALRCSWRCADADGRPLVRVLEDGWLPALVRRTVGTWFGLLRPDFILADQHGVSGRFSRIGALGSAWELDLVPAHPQRLDRRVALGLAVLLACTGRG